MNNMKKATAICIQQYQDEDDLEEYNCGVIPIEEVKVYKVGEIGTVVVGQFHKDYWKLV
jgi:hypothetical protein